MARPYQVTHPWITFELDLRRVPLDVWLLLGEARSKCEHLAGVPLKPAVAQRLHTIYLAKGIQGTTAIEGNTLSEQQVKDIIGGKRDLPKSKEYLQQEVVNILRACEEMVKADKFAITPENICKLNAMVLDGVKYDDEVVPGVLRKHVVGVFKYRAPLGEDCPHLVERMCTWLRQLDEGLPDSVGPIGKAILMAVVAHLYTAWIHPFGDGNGRTARLLEVAILLEAGVPTPAAHLLSNHYNETRNEYYRQLDYASKSNGDIVPFIRYAAQGLVDGLRAQLTQVRRQHLRVVWNDFVHEVLESSDPQQLRCQHLILDLAKVRKFVPRKALMQLSTRVLKHYTGKTDRTLARDLKRLGELGLIEHDPKQGYRARTEAIKAFLPHTKLPRPEDAAPESSPGTKPAPDDFDILDDEGNPLTMDEDFEDVEG